MHLLESPASSRVQMLLTAAGLLRRLASSHTPAGQRASSGIRKHVLYQGRWMVPFRVLVRLKIFQLSGIAACAIPLGTFLSEVRGIAC